MLIAHTEWLILQTQAGLPGVQEPRQPLVKAHTQHSTSDPRQWHIPPPPLPSVSTYLVCVLTTLGSAVSGQLYCILSFPIPITAILLHFLLLMTACGAHFVVLFPAIPVPHPPCFPQPPQWARSLTAWVIVHLLFYQILYLFTFFHFCRFHSSFWHNELRAGPPNCAAAEGFG